MKKTTSLYILLQLLATVLYSQTDQTIYYNNYGHVTSEDSASWYRKVHFTNEAKGECEATDFYMNGVIKRSKGPYIKDLGGMDPNGAFINYDEFGNKETEGTYVSDRDKGIWGKKTGKWTEYYSNGKPSWEYYYQGIIKDNYNDQQVMIYWDSTGTQIVKDGNGQCRYRDKIRLPNDTAWGDVYINSTYKNGRLVGKNTYTFAKTGKLFAEEEYNDGNLIKGVSYDTQGKQYTYTKSDETPVFPGGDAALMRFLQQNIVYPKYERNHNIEGKVLVRFVVEQDGSINDVQVIRSVSKGLDNEAVKVVKMIPRFSPGYYLGQPVRVFYNLPIIYRLQ